MAEPYSNPRNISFGFPAVNFGTGSVRYIPVPANVTASSIRQIMAAVTTTFVGTTTPGKIQIGDGTTVNKYAELDLITANAALGNVFSAYSYKTGIFQRNPNALPFNWLVGPGLYTVTFVAPTGGSPAGIADICIDLDFSYSG